MENERPLVIPFFVSHAGCPFRCVFCDQEGITGNSGIPSPAAVAEETERWLAARKGRRGSVEVAFYGGSFTAIDRGIQERLLAAVRPFLADGRVSGVRISTRPDSLDYDTLEFLRCHGVRTVEVGVQSLNGEVLARSGRGHGPECAMDAVIRLVEAGFVTGVQLMLGLPGETTATAVAGAEKLARLGPDLARIYPTLVIENTGLAALFSRGAYRPLSLARAVALTARIAGIFTDAGVQVIRCGLQAGPELERRIVAGPWHPAFGELVRSRLLFHRLRRVMSRSPGPVRLRLNPADESVLRGRGNCNLARLERLAGPGGLAFSFSAAVPRGEVWPA